MPASLIRAKLKEFLIRRTIVWGAVLLSSGKQSNHYFDGQVATLDAEGSYLVAKMILDMIESDIKNGNINAIGGLMLGAVPIIASTITLSYLENCPINGFIVRKEQKRHGKQKWIEGTINSGDRVIIIDDVTTTGSSVLQAIEKTEETGAKVIKIISIIDRLEGARDRFEKEGYEFSPIFLKDELLDNDSLGGGMMWTKTIVIWCGECTWSDDLGWETVEETRSKAKNQGWSSKITSDGIQDYCPRCTKSEENQ